MGNCMMKGFGGNVEVEMVKVVTSNGGIMELYAPITADSVTAEFPGHGIFPSRSPRVSPPLLHNEQLRPGQYYYLLPLLLDHNMNILVNTTPYRMSVDDTFMKRSTSSDSDHVNHYNYSNTNDFPKRYKKSSTSGPGAAGGVWKVRLVINTDQLSDILSQDNRTEALIHSVRTVARCATTATTAVTVH